MKTGSAKHCPTSPFCHWKTCLHSAWQCDRVVYSALNSNLFADTRQKACVFSTPRMLTRPLPESIFKQNNLIFFRNFEEVFYRNLRKNRCKVSKGIIHHWFTKVPCKTFLWNLLVVFRPLTWRAFRLNPKVKTVWMGQLLLVNWLWMHLAMNDWVFAINTSYSAFVKKATVLSW